MLLFVEGFCQVMPSPVTVLSALLQGPDGNAAAEGAGGPPCLALTVQLPAAGGGEPRLEVQSKTQGWEAKLAGADAGDTLQARRWGLLCALRSTHERTRF